MSVIIRPAKLIDLNFVSECHLEAFPTFFLSLLGKKFLNCFYKAFICDYEANLMVAIEHDRVVGFAAYSKDPNKFFSRLKKKQGAKLLWYALPALFSNPITVVKKLIRGVFYRGDQVPEIDGAALLSSIGVSPTVSGKNIGSKLLAEVESSVLRSGKNKLYLTTDLDNNIATLGFYRKNGYIEHSRFKQSEGRKMLRLIKQLV